MAKKSSVRPAAATPPPMTPERATKPERPRHGPTMTPTDTPIAPSDRKPTGIPPAPVENMDPRCLAVQEVLRELDVTFQTAADMIGTSRSAMSRVANGHQVPSLEWLIKLAAAMGVEPSRFDPLLTDRNLTIGEDGTVILADG